MKAGIKSTEFYVTLITAIVPVIVAIGLLTPEEGEAVTSATVEVVKAIATLAAVLAPVIVGSVYTNGRSKVKAANGKK